MASLKMRRIDLTASDGHKQLAKFRDLLRHDADTLTPAGKKYLQTRSDSMREYVGALMRVLDPK